MDCAVILKESVRRTAQWGAHYYLRSRKSYCPVPEVAMHLEGMPQITALPSFDNNALEFLVGMHMLCVKESWEVKQ